MSISIFVCLAILGSGVELDEPRKYFETLFEPIRTVRFDFEGNVKQFYPSRNLWHPENEFSGSFAYRAGMSLKSETINNKLDIDAKHRDTIRRSWSLNGDDAIGYTIAPNGIESYKFLKQKVVVEEMTKIYQTGCDIFLVPFLMSIASEPGRKFVHSGSEKIGDHLCDLITVSTTSKDDGTLMFTEKFWLDLNRGGHPLKYELLDENDDLEYRIDEIELKQFPDANSKSVWIPISARHQNFISTADTKREGAHPIYRSGDVYRTRSNRVLNGTVQINEDIDDGVFVLRSRNGERITEKKSTLSAKAAISKSEKGMTVKEAQAVLEEKLKAGEESREKVTATSVARDGNESVTRWLPLLLGVTGITGLAGFVFLKAKGH